jgi:hypothetical protein
LNGLASAGSGFAIPKLDSLKLAPLKSMIITRSSFQIP